MYTFTYIHNIQINVNQLIKGTQLSSPFTFTRDREYLAINFTAYCDLTAIKIYTIFLNKYFNKTFHNKFISKIFMHVSSIHKLIFFATYKLQLNKTTIFFSQYTVTFIEQYESVDEGVGRVIGRIHPAPGNNQIRACYLETLKFFHFFLNFNAQIQLIQNEGTRERDSNSI